MMAELTLIAISDNIGLQKWILDSGCTRHMTNCQDRLINFKNESGNIKMVNNDYIESIWYELMELVAAVDRKLNEITLRNVLDVPDIPYNSISVSVTNRNAFKVVIDCEQEDLRTGKMKIVHKNTAKAVMIGVETNDGLYEGGLQTCTGEAAKAQKTKICFGVRDCGTAAMKP